MQRYTCLLFDLDGTISDSASGIVHSVRYALAHFGIQVLDCNDLLPFVGPPLEDSFKEFYHFSDEQAQEAVAKYHEHYKDIGIYENSLYPGITAFLESARQAGYGLCVATSKPQAMADSVLRYFKIHDCFDWVAGRGDDRVSRRTKADVIRYVLEQMQMVDLCKALMIGDRKFDVIGAKTVGIDSVGVLYGYGNRKEFEEAGATYIVRNLSELAALLGLEVKK